MVDIFSNRKKSKLFIAYLVGYWVLQILFGLALIQGYSYFTGVAPTLDQINEYAGVITFLSALATFAWIIILASDELLEFYRQVMTEGSYIRTIGLAFVALYGFNLVAGSIFMFFGIDGTSENQILLEEMILNQPFIMVVPVAFLIPLIEEVIFRGVLLPTFTNKTNWWIAVVAVNSLFALMHVADPESLIFFPIYFGLGVILTYAYKLSNYNLVVPIVAHMLNNFISVIFVFFQ